MPEIKLTKRVKYAGDVLARLMETGWDAMTAAEFCNSIPDADVVEVVRCRNCVAHNRCAAERNYLSEGIAEPFCCRGERKKEKYIDEER